MGKSQPTSLLALSLVGPPVIRSVPYCHPSVLFIQLHISPYPAVDLFQTIHTTCFHTWYDCLFYSNYLKFYQAFLPCKSHRLPGTKAPCSSVRRSLKRMLSINLKNNNCREKLAQFNSPHRVYSIVQFTSQPLLFSMN